MAEDEDLQLLGATRPPQQPHEREQIPDNEIEERPEQAALLRPRHERRTYRAERSRDLRTSLRTLRGFGECQGAPKSAPVSGAEKCTTGSLIGRSVSAAQAESRSEGA